MHNRALGGPSGSVQWEEKHLGGEASRPLTLMLLPDAANDISDGGNRPAVYYYLPRAPQLQLDVAGNPVFSLTLLLSRRPNLGDESIQPLIQQGHLNFTLSLAVSPQLLAQLSAIGQADYQPLFAREVTLSLERSTEYEATTITSTPGSGASVRITLSTALDQQQSLDLLSALDGSSSGLILRTKLLYHTAAATQVVQLTGNWAEIYDDLSYHLRPAKTVSRADLQTYFSDMLNSSLVSVTQVSSAGANSSVEDVDRPSLFAMFMRVSSVILQRTTPELDLVDPSNQYTLRARPNDMFELNIEQTLSSVGKKSLELITPLEEVIGGALEGMDSDRFIHLVSPMAGSDRGLGPVPRRVTTAPRTRGLQSKGEDDRVALAVTAGSVKSIALAMRPESVMVRPAYALLMSEAIQGAIVDDVVGRRWKLDDVDFHRLPGWEGGPQQPRDQNLPVVDDPGAPLWHDRVNTGQYWYAPVFEVVQPALNDATDSSPFLFSYTVVGHDNAGKPVLDGNVRMTLRQRMSDQTRIAWQNLGSPEAHPVPMIGLSVSLTLPFVDESTGAASSQPFQGIVEQVGDTVKATISLSNPWVRVCYGNLAIANFQKQPAQLSVAYTYQAYVPVRDDAIHIVYGDKIFQTPVVYSRDQLAEIREQPCFNATDISYQLPVGKMQFTREATRRTTSAKAAPSSRQIGTKMPTANAALLATTAVAFQPAGSNAFVAKPRLESDAILQGIVQQTKYAIQSHGFESSVDVLFPCNTMGAFYIETSDAGQTDIGCRDDFQLGQTTFALYEIISDADLTSPLYSAYRSLLQPGRFLIVPRTYRITRFAPTEGEKAYRPAILLYSTLDATVPANNRCVVMATLQPDMPPYLQREVRSKLAARVPLNHTLVAQYITEIEGQYAYQWSIPTDPTSGQPVAQVQAAKMWDSFQVTLSTDLAGSLQLQQMLQKSGVSANVNFTLRDKSQLQTQLVLDLNEITGPWSSGPIEVVQESNNAKLTNKIERSISVTDLIIYQSSGPGQSIGVNQTIKPGDPTYTVPLPTPATEVYSVFTIQPGDPATLQEIRSFVEDIHTNVVFVNLVNYANHNVKKLDVQARIKDVPGTYPVSIGEATPGSEAQGIGEIDIILPLTTYLANPVLEFQVTKTTNSAEISATAWLEWSLETRGNVVSLTWDLIQ